MVAGTAPARSGLVGHPSDGYHGGVLALALPQFTAKVELNEGGSLPAGGAGQLIGSAMESYRTWATAVGLVLDEEAPSGASLQTDIPREVGLAGSSAIVIATLRAMGGWFAKPIGETLLGSVALQAERSLGISAGLQDRVVQSLGGLVHMDFGVDAMRVVDGYQVGTYTRLDPSHLPPLFVVWLPRSAESSAVVHDDLRRRWSEGRERTHRAMAELRDLAVVAAELVRGGPVDVEPLGELLTAGFLIRRSLVELRPEHLALVEAVQSVAGVHATYTGSGGAVIGTWSGSAADLEALQRAVAGIGAEIATVQAAP